MTDSNHSTNEHAEHPPEGTVAWFFFEFWPIVLFGGLFVLMCTLPLIFSGFLSLQALGIGLAFLLAFAVTFLATRFLGLYLFALGVIAFTLQPQAFSMATWVGLFFLLFVLIGAMVLPQKKSN